VYGKCIFMPDGSIRFAPEYESCRAIADAHGMTVAEVMADAQVAYKALADKAGESSER
jgi:hypothetical protein